MPYIRKKQITVYLDPSGKRVRKFYPGVLRKKGFTKKWYGFFREKGKTFTYPLSKDRHISQTMFLNILRQRELEKAGLVSPYKRHLERPIVEHLEDYLDSLREEGRTTYHIQHKSRILRTIFCEMRISTFPDFTVDKVDLFLKNMKKRSVRNKNIPSAPNTKLSYRNSLVSFANWLKRKGRIENNHLIHVNIPRGKPLRVRRALTQDEIRRLLNAARQRSLEEGKNNRGGKMPDGSPRKRGKVLRSGSDLKVEYWRDLGEERCLLYKTALYTGLRKGELFALKVGFLDMESKPFPSFLPSFLLPSSRGVHQKWQSRIDLHPSVPG